MLTGFLAQNLTFIINIFLSLLAGFIIGGERELRGKEAGISTHTLVILGAMLFSVMSFSVGAADNSRIAAQIVTGIGFIGAGLILKDGVRVKNLTTAASIWFAAAIGMSIGFGFYGIAMISTIACVLTPRIPKIGKNT